MREGSSLNLVHHRYMTKLKVCYPLASNIESLLNLISPSNYGKKKTWLGAAHPRLRPRCSQIQTSNLIKCALNSALGQKMKDYIYPKLNLN